MLNKAKVSVFLASKNITKGNKGISLFTIFVMSLIFLQLILTSSIIDGTTVQLSDLSVEFQTGNVVIEPKEEEIFIENTAALQKKIENLPEVRATSGRLKAAGAIRYKEKEVGATILGIDPSEETSVTDLENAMVSGEFLSRLDRGEIILGREISGGFGALQEAKSLGGVEVGDNVEIRIDGMTREFRVKGIYTTLFFVADASAYINKEDMEEILQVEDKTHEISIKTIEGVSSEEARMKLLSLGIKEKILTWQELSGILSLVEETFAVTRVAMNFIGLLVGFVVIFVVIYVNIVNKTRHIGVQKAIGVSEEVIVLSFFLQALFYAVCGIVLGYLIMRYAISPISQIYPIKMPVGFITLGLDNLEALSRAILLLLATAIGSVVPAYDLAKKDLLTLIWGK